MEETDGNTQEYKDGFVTGRVMEYGANPKHYGTMNRPDGYARVTGPCGDTDEIFLRIQEGKITVATFTTNGCLFSLAACNAAAQLATGTPLHQCLEIDQPSILEHLSGLPEDHVHCALLAATTLHQAVTNYVAAQKTGHERESKPPKNLSEIRDRQPGASGRKIKDQILL